MKESAGFKRVASYLIFVTVFIMALAKIGDYDIWYHLRAGQYILQTRAINHLEPFSFTITEAPWSVQSWLAGVVFFIAHSIGGIPGLIVFNALMVAAVFYILYRTMRASTVTGGASDTDESPALAVVILLIAAFAMRFRFQARPHIFEFIFLASTLYLLELYRGKGKNRLFLVPVIQILWVNVHASHILGLIIPVIFIAGEYAGGFIGHERNGQRMRAYGLVLAANVAATFVNPLTYKAFLMPLLITGQSTYMQNIGEWQPMTLGHFWGYSLRYTWGFAVLAIVAVAGFIYRGKKSSLTDILIFVFFLAMAIKGIRLMAEFALATSPIIHRNLAAPTARMLRDKAKPVMAALAAIMVVVVMPLTVFSQTYSFGIGVKKNIFPERAVDFIEANGIQGNVFNSFAFGDYLVWRRFPAAKVFIHGRNEVFPEAFYKDYLAAHTDGAKWREVTERYNIDYALLEYYATDLEGKEAIYHLAGNLNWTPVYWDRVSIVYVKNTAANQPIIDRLGFHFIRPSYLDFSYLSRYPGTPAMTPALEELDRLILISPENEEAYLARAYLRFMMGDVWYDQAIADIKKAVEINPAQAMSHSALGMLYQRKGEKKEAADEYNAALRLDPQDPAAKAGLAPKTKR